MEITIVYRGYIGIMEKKMETTIVDWDEVRTGARRPSNQPKDCHFLESGSCKEGTIGDTLAEKGVPNQTKQGTYTMAILGTGFLNNCQLHLRGSCIGNYYRG